MLMNTGHHPGRLVHSQYQSEHYCMLYRLHIRLWQCSLNTTVLDTMHTLNSILTFCICISQLLADHSSINVVPGVVTHCPPLVIDAHLHSTLILIGASHQTNISIGADATGIDCNGQMILSKKIIIFCMQVALSALCFFLSNLQ